MIPPRNDFQDIVNALEALDFVEGADYVYRKGSVCAAITGRVVMFHVSGMPEEVYGSLYDEDFVPQNVMEVFQHKKGIRALVDAFIDVQAQAMNYEEKLKEYSDGVVAYFAARNVPVVADIYRRNGETGRFVADIRISDECVRNRKSGARVTLFTLDVRFDMGVSIEFAGGHSYLVDGDDVAANLELVFGDEDLLQLTPENPVDRVDYSTSYHYQHIVNAIPDMLRVGLVDVWRSDCEIVTTLSDQITSCNKHFTPKVLGTITDFSVKFKSTIHTDKAWNE